MATQNACALTSSDLGPRDVLRGRPLFGDRTLGRYSEKVNFALT
jgi:hypothetical protein